MRKPRIIHFGFIKNGKKVYFNPELYLNQIKGLEGKEFEEEIREKFKKASQATLGYYRGGIILSALTSEKFAGWTKEEVHEYFTDKYLGETIEKHLGDKRVEFKSKQSTSDLDQAEMNIYIDLVVKDLAHEGIEVLPPEQYNLTKYRKVSNE